MHTALEKLFGDGGGYTNTNYSAFEVNWLFQSKSLLLWKSVHTGNQQNAFHYTTRHKLEYYFHFKQYLASVNSFYLSLFPLQEQCQTACFCSEILISVFLEAVFQEVTRMTDMWKAFIFWLERDIFLPFIRQHTFPLSFFGLQQNFTYCWEALKPSLVQLLWKTQLCFCETDTFSCFNQCQRK